MDASKLPAYSGVENEQNGYILLRVDAVKEVAVVDDTKHVRYMHELRQITGEEMFQAFLADTRKGADVTVKAFAASQK